jgi:hypothetical protein
MLRQFQNLLRHDPCVFGKQQLVQIMAINMYQIEVAKQVNVSGILAPSKYRLEKILRRCSFYINSKSAKLLNKDD